MLFCDITNVRYVLVNILTNTIPIVNIAKDYWVCFGKRSHFFHSYFTNCSQLLPWGGRNNL
ncbi:hypothetical protein DX933_01605 [Ornithinibacillus gellani]|nr:hypothetical protein DX933_01605 [Ornithinibacillus gellani]